MRMQLKHRFTRMTSLFRLQAGLLTSLAILLVACGSDLPEPSTPTISPTPTSFVAPTPDTSTNLSSAAAALLDLDELRDFPDSLRSESTPLTQQKSKAEWDQFLSGTRVIAGTTTIVDFCSDHTGRWIASETRQLRYEGESFEWSIAFGLGDRWNQPRLSIEFRDLIERNEEDTGDFTSELIPPDINGKMGWSNFGGTMNGTVAVVSDMAVYSTNSCEQS